MEAVGGASSRHIQSPKTLGCRTSQPPLQPWDISMIFTIDQRVWSVKGGFPNKSDSTVKIWDILSAYKLSRIEMDIYINLEYRSYI